MENSTDSYFCFQRTFLHSVSYFFSLYQSLSLSLCTVFDAISSNIDKVLSINPSANVFVFGDFIVHHKNWSTCSGGSERPCEICYDFSAASNDLTQMVNFLLGSLTVTLTILLLWIFFFLLMQVFVLQWLSLYCCKILIVLLSQFPLTFCQT